MVNYFKKVKLKSENQKFLDVQQFQSGLSSNIAVLRLKKGLKLLKRVKNFTRFQTLGETLIVSKEVNIEI